MKEGHLATSGEAAGSRAAHVRKMTLLVSDNMQELPHSLMSSIDLQRVKTITPPFPPRTPDSLRPTLARKHTGKGILGNIVPM